MASELLRCLRLANREFQEFIDGPQQSSPLHAVAQLERINTHLAQVARGLSPLPQFSPQQAELAIELVKYRQTLQSLSAALAALQSSLQSEKTRIESLSRDTRSAAAWAKSIRIVNSK